MRTSMIFLFPLFFGSCISSSMLEKAATDRKPQKAHQIQDAWADTAGNIIVNFTAKLSGSKRNVPVHMIVPVQTLMRIHLGYRSIDGAFSAGEKLLYGVNRTHTLFHTRTISDSLKGYVPEIELMQEKIQEGFYDPQPGDINISSQFKLPIDAREYGYEVNGKYKKQQRLVMIYQPAEPFQARYVAINTIVLSVEPSQKRKYSRYWLMPATVSADIVTSPFQGIGIGFTYLLAWAMRF